MLFCMTLLGFVFLVLGAVLTGGSNYLERYMHAFFLFTPLWLMWLVTRCDSAAQPKSIGIVLLAATLAVVPVRAVNLAWALEPDCGSCRLAVPYESLAAKLKSMGFATGTLMVMDRNDGGNLRRFFRKARIALLRRPYFAPTVRPQDLHTPAVIVWRSKHGGPLPFSAAPAIWQIGGTVVGEPESVNVPTTVLGDQRKPRDWTWTKALVAPSPGPQL
jgi:hypothetical protein